MTESHDKRPHTNKVPSADLRYGRFFGFYSLTGETEGVLSIYIRMQKSKHYELYERRAFKSAAEASRFVDTLGSGIPMFVVNPYFK